MPYKDPAKAKAQRRNREHIRRASVSDITAEQETAMRNRARTCPLCQVRLTAKLGLPNSKHLDHIIPLCQGGTHTHGNVRITCATCNLHRPRDGSDYTGPITLWAQGPAIPRPDRRANTGTCRNGLHLWPENRKVIRGKTRCAPCYEAGWRRRLERRGRGAEPQVCRCGESFAAPGRTLMCPACTITAGLRGAELHAAGMTWQQVALALGYTTAEGARYAAKRVCDAA